MIQRAEGENVNLVVFPKVPKNNDVSYTEKSTGKELSKQEKK
jgi:hypothetical protein